MRVDFVLVIIGFRFLHVGVCLRMYVCLCFLIMLFFTGAASFITFAFVIITLIRSRP